MMNKDFVPYAEALALKELGFDEPCFGIWMERGDRHDVIYVAKQEDAWMAEQNDGILAPLYQQAFKWFRDKHNLFANIHSTRSWVNSYKIIYWDDSCDSTTIWDGEKNYKIREESELACLVTLIEIVKQKQ